MVTMRPPSTERIAADIQDLAALTSDGPGWSRVLFSEPEIESRHLVAQKMAAAGMEVSIDAAGNVIGTLPGTARGVSALLTGSHTDTVPGGGRFDGVVGVVGGIEVVRLLAESGLRLAHDLCVIDFRGEEPNVHGSSYVGSRALAGTLRPEHLSQESAEGKTLATALSGAGGDPDGALRAAWGVERIAGYIELHVEQGPHLEQRGTSVGVVSSIVGIQRMEATFTGRADHAGTCPMPKRRDAGCVAAETMLVVERLGRAGSQQMGGDAVATVGAMGLSPGAINVVPGVAQLLAEARSTDQRWLAAFRDDLEAEVRDAAGRREVEASLIWVEVEPPTPMDALVGAMIADAADRLGYSRTELASFAGHDAAQIASLAPTGMIFVPSRDGRSHCAEEWTDLTDIGVGVGVLGEALVAADRQLR